jgi:predicted nucleotidyltransferase
MDLRDRWSTLDELCRCAARFPGLEIWAFGSMLRSSEPHDLDVLIIYDDANDVVAMRERQLWEVTLPPVDIIAMTRDEEIHYDFVEVTRAVRLHPPT